MAERMEDRYGIWELNADGVRWDLIERFPEVGLPSTTIVPEPTQEEINVEFDYRLSLVELGLNQGGI